METRRRTDIMELLLELKADGDEWQRGLRSWRKLRARLGRYFRKWKEVRADLLGELLCASGEDVGPRLDVRDEHTKGALIGSRSCSKFPADWWKKSFTVEGELGTGPGKNSVAHPNSYGCADENKLRGTGDEAGTDYQPLGDEECRVPVLPDKEGPGARKTWRNYSNQYKKFETLAEEALQQSVKAKDREEKVAWLERAREYTADVKELADLIWQKFQPLMFPGCVPTISYDKQEMDTAMEECFGSMNQPGDFTFRWGENSVPLVEVEDYHRAFSLYLARKSICPKSFDDIPKSVESFAYRVLRPAPESDGRGRAIQIMRVLTNLLFDADSLEEYKRKNPNVPTHSSGCIERPRSDGGKRAAYWGEPLEPCNDVKPVGISTGGKIRVITIDSARNLDYAYLNGYMASRIRSCDWSVFGKEVSEWMEGKTLEGEVVSGDLESATDLFDGAFAEVVMERLCQVDEDLDDEDYFRMCSFTTRASLVFEDEALLLNLKQDELTPHQKRGQLMGSILSFPILCLVSLTAFLFGREDLVRGISNPDRRVALKVLRGIDVVGVNGDDIVFACKDRGAAWAAGVEAVGGKVSRGKSLCSEKVFTVNSELWVKSGGVWTKPGAVRLSLLTGICAGRKTSPSKSWEHLIAGGIRLPKELSDLIKERWNMRLPPSLGGTGLVKDFSAFENLVAKIVRESRRRIRLIRPARAWAGYRGKALPKIKVMLPVKEVDLVRRWTKRVELREGLPEWSNKGKAGLSWREAMKEARTQWRHVTKGEIQALRDQWTWEWRMYERGYKRSIVPNVPWITSMSKPIKAQKFDHLEGPLGADLEKLDHLARNPEREWVTSDAPQLDVSEDDVGRHLWARSEGGWVLRASLPWVEGDFLGGRALREENERVGSAVRNLVSEQ